MTRIVSDILAAKEPEFSHKIEQWETMSGRPGIDIRLNSELANATKEVVGNLGLDVDDTTNKEFYYALIKRAKDDNRKLCEYLQISNADTPSQIAQKVVKFVDGATKQRQIWAMKPSVTKRILKEIPPKKLMKTLSYRSIDSVLKRETAPILIGLNSLVDPLYRTKILARYKKVSTSDFDERKVDIEILPIDQIQKIRKSHDIDSPVLNVYETGSLVVIPASKRYDGDVILMFAALLEGFKKTVLYSNYFRMLSVRPKFGDNLGHVLEVGLASSSQKFVATGWSSLHELAKTLPENLPESLQPHLQKDDLLLPTLSLFANQLPELEFWASNDHLARHDSTGVASCNLLDVVINASNKVAYEDGIRLYAQMRLWDMLVARYLAYEPVNRIVINLE